ncbi:MAG: O-antigen ligase family protein, partial [Gemmatimonadaceae bacterium]|nr:O-antigen ligase family protein [Gemmatimonadaceae bacterium]
DPGAPPPSHRVAPKKIWWGPLCALFITLTWAAAPVIGFVAALRIVAIFGFAAMIIGLRFPTLGLLGVAILCTIDAPARVYILTGGLLRWNTMNYWLLLVMLLYIPFLIRLRDPHSLILAVFVALLGIELVISPDLTDGVQNILGIIATFGLLIYFVRAGHDRRMWFWLGVVVGLLGALGGLMFFLQRLHLMRINENAWATFPLGALLVVFFAFPSAASLKRGQPTLMALAAANLVWIFLSGSRGTLLIGICCVIDLVMGMRGLRQRTIALTTAALLGVAAAAHFAKLQDRALFRIVKLFTLEHDFAGNYSLASRTSGRSDLAIGGWDIFKAHPFGVGSGGFPTAWENLDRHYQLVYGRGEKKAAHSGWLKTLVENGIPGIVLLFAYVCSFAAVGLRQRDRNLLRMSFITSGALMAALLATEFQSKGLWFLAAGMTTFLHRDALRAAMFPRRFVPRARPVLRASPAAFSHDAP